MWFLNPIEQNALYILKILVEEDIEIADGNLIKKKSSFKPQEINDAIEYLEDLGAVKVFKGLRSASYNFSSVEVKGKGRYLYHETFSDSRGSIIDQNNPSSFEDFKIESKEETSKRRMNQIYKFLALLIPSVIAVNAIKGYFMGYDIVFFYITIAIVLLILVLIIYFIYLRLQKE